MLPRVTAERIGHIGAAAIRDQRNTMFFRCLDQIHYLGFGCGINHDVRNASQPGVFDRVHFLLSVSMPVAEAHFSSLVQLIRPQELLQVIDKSRRNLRVGNGSGIAWGVDISWIHVAFENLTDPRQKAR